MNTYCQVFDFNAHLQWIFYDSPKSCPPQPVLFVGCVENLKKNLGLGDKRCLPIKWCTRQKTSHRQISSIPNFQQKCQAWIQIWTLKSLSAYKTQMQIQIQNTNTNTNTNVQKWIGPAGWLFKFNWKPSKWAKFVHLAGCTGSECDSESVPVCPSIPKYKNTQMINTEIQK